MLWNIILWILIGFVIGWLARLVSPRRMPKGFWKTTLVGVVGSIVGGGIANLLELDAKGASPGNFNFWSIVVAVVGAIVVMWILGLLRKGRQ